jgi:hypothetical protein
MKKEMRKSQKSMMSAQVDPDEEDARLDRL